MGKCDLNPRCVAVELTNCGTPTLACSTKTVCEVHLAKITHGTGPSSHRSCYIKEIVTPAPTTPAPTIPPMTCSDIKGLYAKSDYVNMCIHCGSVPYCKSKLKQKSRTCKCKKLKCKKCKTDKNCCLTNPE